MLPEVGLNTILTEVTKLVQIEQFEKFIKVLRKISLLYFFEDFVVQESQLLLNWVAISQVMI